MGTVRIILLLLIVLFMTTVSLSSFITISSANSRNKNLKGRTLPIPDNPLTPPNQAPVTSLSRDTIASGA
jgi:hypothetical protein